MWIGALFFGVLSDKKGRRLGFLVSTTMTFVFSLLSSFAPTYWILVILRGLVGVGLGGITIPFTLFTEFLPIEKRGLYLILINTFWTIGTVFSAGMAWYIFFSLSPSQLPVFGWKKKNTASFSLLLGLSSRHSAGGGTSLWPPCQFSFPWRCSRSRPNPRAFMRSADSLTK